MAKGKTLFVSPVQPIAGCTPSIYNWDKPSNALNISLSFLNHPGLQFLKANVECDILEYPDATQYAQALQTPPDILGISFYINETEIVIRMIEQARAAGVKKIWGGNLGAYSPEVEGYFDKVFHGWGEAQVAEALETELKSSTIIHPPIYCCAGSRLSDTQMVGMLFTSRGCPWTCNFCQTPSFYDTAQRVPLEAVDKVLWEYHRQGITGINILDENFGTFPKHAAEVASLLYSYKMRWIALTRTDTLLKNFDNWVSKGLYGAHIGIESLSQKALEVSEKRVGSDDNARLLKKMSRHNMFVQAFYIIGFETDTEESIKRDIKHLKTLDIDLIQVQVLTPYPRTGQTETIKSQYGIDDRNLSRYNSRHLVWNHPTLSVDKVKELQTWANKELCSNRKSLRTLSKMLLHDGKPGLSTSGILNGLSTYYKTAELRKANKMKIDSAKLWAQRKWHGYEEVSYSDSISQSDHLLRIAETNPLNVVNVS